MGLWTHISSLPSSSEVTEPQAPPNIEEALHAGKLLWVDLHDSGDESLALLRDVFHIHPLAMEDAAEFGQHPKIEEYRPTSSRLSSSAPTASASR